MRSNITKYPCTWDKGGCARITHTLFRMFSTYAHGNSIVPVDSFATLFPFFSLFSFAVSSLEASANPIVNNAILEIRFSACMRCACVCWQDFFQRSTRVSIQTGSFLVTIFFCAAIVIRSNLPTITTSPHKHTPRSHTHPHCVDEDTEEGMVRLPLKWVYFAVLFRHSKPSISILNYFCFSFVLSFCWMWQWVDCRSPAPSAWWCRACALCGSIEMENDGKKNPQLDATKTMHTWRAGMNISGSACVRIVSQVSMQTTKRVERNGADVRGLRSNGGSTEMEKNSKIWLQDDRPPLPGWKSR